MSSRNQNEEQEQDQTQQEARREGEEGLEQDRIQDLSENAIPPGSSSSSSTTHLHALRQIFVKSLKSFFDSKDEFRVLKTLSNSTDTASNRSGTTNKASPNNSGGSAQHGERTNAYREKRKKRLLVLDSSFNPPTKAHLYIVRSAVEHYLPQSLGIHVGGEGEEGGEGESQIELRVLLLLATQNADKGVKPAAFEDRLVMMCAMGEELRRELGRRRRRRMEDSSSGSGSRLKSKPTGDDTTRKEATEQSEKKGQAEADPDSEFEVESGVEADVGVDICVTKKPYFVDKAIAIANSPNYKQSDCSSPATTSSDTPPASTTNPTPSSSNLKPSQPSQSSKSQLEQVHLIGYDTILRIFSPKYYTSSPGGISILNQFFTENNSRLRMLSRTDEGTSLEDQRAYVQAIRDGKMEVEAECEGEIGGKRSMDVKRSVCKEWGDCISVVGEDEGKEEEKRTRGVSSTEARKCAELRNWDEDELGRYVPASVRDYVTRMELYRKEAEKDE